MSKCQDPFVPKFFFPFCRPFTNALHAAVGVGFWGGTLLVRPFQPEVRGDEDREEQHREEACQTKKEQEEGVELSSLDNSTGAEEEA